MLHHNIIKQMKYCIMYLGYSFVNSITKWNIPPSYGVSAGPFMLPCHSVKLCIKGSTDTLGSLLKK